MRAVNLIPKDERGGASVGAGRSEGAAYAVLGVLAVVAVLALLYGQAHHKLASRKAEAAALTARAQEAQAEASKLAPYTSFVQLRQQREQAVSTLVDSRFDWAHAFHEFGRVLSADTAITSLDGTVGSAATATATAAPAPSPTAAASVTSATPAGSVPTFTIQGCGKNQRAVALMLERLRLIDGVSEVTLQSSTKSATSGSAGGAGGSGSCPASAPAFSVSVVFDALPSTAAAAAVAKPAAKTVSNSTSGAAASTGGK